MEQPTASSIKKKTNAGRCRDYRAKRKSKEQDFDEKEKERIRNYWAKKKLSLTERDKNLIRDKERIRKQKYRQNLKKQKLGQQICQSQTTEPTVNTYKTHNPLERL